MAKEIKSEVINHLGDGEDWQILFWALCESQETDKEVAIDEHFGVRMHEWSYGELFFTYTDEELLHDGWLSTTTEVFVDNGAMCCEDAEEFAAEVASGLLEQFGKWYERQRRPVDSIFDATCWEQAELFYLDIKSGLEESVFQNCVWGWEGMEYSLKTLLDNEWNYGLSIERTKELWTIAYWWVAEGCMREVA